MPKKFKIQDLGFRNGILILILITYILNPTSARGASDTSLSSQIDTVREQRDALIAEQTRLQTELDKVSAEGQNLGTAVKSLDATKKKLAADIAVTQSKIKSADLTIDLLGNKVSAAEEDIKTHRKAIGETIYQISATDHRSLALDLLSSVNFADLWSDASQVRSFSSALTTEVGSLRTTKATLAKQKEEKEKTKELALALTDQLTGQKKVVEESKAAEEKLLAETKSKEAAYQALLAENRAREKEFEDELFRLESQLNLTLDPSKIPAPHHGLLAWPLDKIFVTTYFGRQSGSALRIYASGTHNGTDFRASQGTRVLAMGGGVVRATGNTDEEPGCGSYGRWVLIEYPTGLSSVYGHLSASVVTAGQAVAAGQVVGYSGGTPGVFGSGYSTGPHLHVGLFATQGIEVRQFVESKGCKEVVVPIADVRAYLDPLAYLPTL
jgi:murein DD-endopeptidase MepM/ murein hydrolase activator NlpD